MRCRSVPFAWCLAPCDLPGLSPASQARSPTSRRARKAWRANERKPRKRRPCPPQTSQRTACRTQPQNVACNGGWKGFAQRHVRHNVIPHVSSVPTVTAKQGRHRRENVARHLSEHSTRERLAGKLPGAGADVSSPHSLPRSNVVTAASSPALPLRHAQARSHAGIPTVPKQSMG